MTNQVFAFRVWVIGTDWVQTINARNAGKAKAQMLIDVRESWPDVAYTDMRVRKLGAPISSPDFIRCAAYRGRPETRCGDRVRLGSDTGTIIGHNSSTNWSVLFDDAAPRYAGLILGVHPAECEYLS